MNLMTAAHIIEKIRQWGVVDFCLCAGARNSPFITLIDENRAILEKKGRIFNFFDERSAGFFALGRAQSTQKPVAIITTSGTAATELISATVEAYYTQTPLLLITADRPPSYRKSGAPQAIEQVGIFTYYSEPTIDLFQDLSRLNNLEWSQKIPLHLNVCFDEPLLSGAIPKLLESPNLNPEVTKSILTTKDFLQKPPICVEAAGLYSSAQNMNFFKKCQNPLFILSGLIPQEKSTVSSLFQNLNPKFSGSLWIETLSGLRGHPQLETRRIKSSDAFLQKCFTEGVFDGVIRIGAVPTLRLWRDLEDKWKTIPVLNVSDSPWSGLSRNSEQMSFSELPLILQNYASRLNKCESIYQQDLILSKKINSLFDQFPRAEQSMVKKLSLLVGENPLYLGNSLPIREWDFAAQSILLSATFGNRGANGIDGQLSTFLGWKPSQKHAWALVGDLTALYDLNAPWILPQTELSSWTIAIMNNSGGQIFKPMFHREAFLNRHSIDFKNWAAMWNLSYEKTETLEGKWHNPPQILEILPCEEQTKNLNQELAALWKTLS